MERGHLQGAIGWADASLLQLHERCAHLRAQPASARRDALLARYEELIAQHEAGMEQLAEMDAEEAARTAEQAELVANPARALASKITRARMTGAVVMVCGAERAAREMVRCGAWSATCGSATTWTLALEGGDVRLTVRAGARMAALAWYPRPAPRGA